MRRKRRNRELKLAAFIRKTRHQRASWPHQGQLPWEDERLTERQNRGWHFELSHFGMSHVPWFDPEQDKHPAYWQSRFRHNIKDCPWYESELEKEKRHVKRQTRIMLHHAIRDIDPLDNEDNHHLDVA